MPVMAFEVGSHVRHAGLRAVAPSRRRSPIRPTSTTLSGMMASVTSVGAS
jgi:hypothetical protein